MTSEQFQDIKTIKKTDLATLNLVTQYQGKKVPTIAGMLLFGKKCFPDAWIQAGRFEGKDKSNITDSESIENHLISGMNEAISFVEKYVSKAVKIGRVKHTVTPGMPLVALREAIINAVVHAEYSQSGSPIRISIFDNQVEIENPGLLYYGLTVQYIKSGISKLRNRTIGKIFKTLELIEQWGSGIQRIIRSCNDGGFPEPKFEEIGTHFRATIYSSKQRKPLHDPVDKKIISQLEINQKHGMTTGEIATKIKLSNRATRTRLIKLIDSGIIVEIASSAQDPNRLYFLVDHSYDD